MFYFIFIISYFGMATLSWFCTFHAVMAHACLLSFRLAHIQAMSMHTCQAMSYI